jgi:hypothetical protein
MKVLSDRSPGWGRFGGQMEDRSEGLEMTDLRSNPINTGSSWHSRAIVDKNCLTVYIDTSGLIDCRYAGGSILYVPIWTGERPGYRDSWVGVCR